MDLAPVSGARCELISRNCSICGRHSHGHPQAAALVLRAPLSGEAPKKMTWMPGTAAPRELYWDSVAIFLSHVRMRLLNVAIKLPCRNGLVAPRTANPEFLKHRLTSHGHPDVSALKPSISRATPGCALSSQPYVFVPGGSVLYLH
jgi:hypothetical protein